MEQNIELNNNEPVRLQRVILSRRRSISHINVTNIDENERLTSNNLYFDIYFPDLTDTHMENDEFNIIENIDKNFIIEKMMQSSFREVTEQKIPIIKICNEKTNTEYILCLNIGFSDKKIVTNIRIDDIDISKIKSGDKLFGIIIEQGDIKYMKKYDNYCSFEVIFSNFVEKIGIESISEIESIICSELKYPDMFDKKEIYETIKAFLDIYGKIINFERYNICYNLDSAKIDYYGPLYNNPKRFLKKKIDDYKKFLDENIEEDTLPDIYMCSGLSDFPTKYEKKITNSTNNYYDRKCIKLNTFANYFFIIFKQSPYWFYINMLVCFSVQILAPIYYISDYLDRNNNVYCPNESNFGIKFFGTIFFLTLYSQYSDMQDKIVQLHNKFSHTFLIKYRIALVLSYVINQLVTFIIPIVTFVLFLDDPSILGFILNCLTAVFLIELDDLMSSASSGKLFMQIFIHDKMILSYIRYGIRQDDFIKKLYENKYISCLITVSSMLQVALMFYLSIRIGTCL